MAYSKFVNGFQVTTKSAIDKRIILTKAEMLSVSQGSTYLVPSLYFAMCSDDGKLYMYDAGASIYEEDGSTLRPTGKYYLIEDRLDFTQSESTQQTIEKAIKDSETVSGIEDLIVGETESGATYSRVAALEEAVESLKMDGGEIAEDTEETE